MHKIYKRKLTHAAVLHEQPPPPLSWCLFISNEAHASAFELLFPPRTRCISHLSFFFHFAFEIKQTSFVTTYDDFLFHQAEHTYVSDTKHCEITFFTIYMSENHREEKHNKYVHFMIIFRHFMTKQECFNPLHSTVYEGTSYLNLANNSYFLFL